MLTIEYLNAKEIFLKLVGASCERALHDALQKARHALGVGEAGTLKNSIEFRANLTRIHRVTPGLTRGRGV